MPSSYDLNDWKKVSGIGHGSAWANPQSSTAATKSSKPASKATSKPKSKILSTTASPYTPRKYSPAIKK
ncbi:hypothetical protein NX059_001053 [Plenodomus lindquistii]|nr:hypothetical protein NX059_001053 [Plenodomus lindquistii]